MAQQQVVSKASPQMEAVKEATKQMIDQGFGAKFDGSTDPFHLRQIIEMAQEYMAIEPNVEITPVMMGGIEGELHTPQGARDDAILIYIHGGGFVSGSASASRSYCSMLAAYTGFRVISAEYRLSPENKFPDGLEDCYNILRVIRKKYPDSKLVLAGESAGGNMSLALALKARDRGRRSIAAVIAHSPLVDFTGALDRTQHEIDDFTVKEGFIEPMRIAYAGDADPSNPYISPFYGDYKGMPPIFLTVDYNETLFADSMAIYRKCRAAETPVRMVQMKGTFHAFATMGTRTPETEKILRENTSFIMRYLNQDMMTL